MHHLHIILLQKHYAILNTTSKHMAWHLLGNGIVHAMIFYNTLVTS